MKKFYLFVLMAVGLLVSGNAGAAVIGSGTIDDPFKSNVDPKSSPNAFKNDFVNIVNNKINSDKVYVYLAASISNLSAEDISDLHGAKIKCSATANTFSFNTKPFSLSNFTLELTEGGYFCQVGSGNSLTLTNATIKTSKSFIILVTSGEKQTITVENCTFENNNKVFDIRVSNTVVNLVNDNINLINRFSYTVGNPLTTGKINWIVKGGYSGEFTSSTVPADRTLRDVTIENGGTLTVTSGTVPSLTCNGGTTNIAGGTVTSLTCNGGSVSITGGIIMAGSNLSNLAAGSITGGYFATSGFDKKDMDALLNGVIPAGYAYKVSGSNYEIYQKKEIAKIGSKTYESFVDACTEVQSGETIEILDNIKSGAFDISGKSITITGAFTMTSPIFSLSSPATVTFGENTIVENLSTTGSAPLTITNNNGKTTIIDGQFGNNIRAMLVSGKTALRIDDIYYVHDSFADDVFFYNFTKEKSYTTFMSAILGVNEDGNDILVLTKDAPIGVTGKGYAPYTYESRSFTLELSDHTLSVSVSDMYFRLTDNANIVIRNGKMTNIIDGTNQIVKIDGANATLTLQDVTMVNSEGSCLGVSKIGTTINFEGNTSFTGQGGIINVSAAVDLTLNNHANTNYTSYDLFTTNANKLPNITINNYGTFAMKVDELDNVASLALNNNAGGNLTIEKNTFTTISNEGNLTINGGAFTEAIGGTIVSVSGGIFTEAAYNSIKDHIAAGGKVVEVMYKGQKAYKIIDSSLSPIAQLKGKDYYYLEDALLSLAPQETVTITLLNDASLTEDVTLADEQQVTIDMNGHDIAANKIIALRHAQVILTGHGKYNVNAGIAFNLYGKDLDEIPAPDIDKMPEVPYGYVGLTIDEDVTLYNPSSAIAFSILNETYPTASVWTTQGYGAAEGVKVDIKGTLQNCNGGVNGYCYAHKTEMGDTYIPTNGNIPLITIYPTAEIVNNGIALQLGGYARTIFEGGEILGRVDVRAGEVIVNGGTFTNNNNDSVVFEGNKNGSAVKQGSCNITLAQHTTKLPVIVTINGGWFNAITPIAQGNPQENEEHSAELVKCYIKGGHFWSKSATPDADILKSEENNRIFATAGFYNANPDVRCIAKGYQAKSTVTDYPNEYSEKYTYYIGLPSQQGTIDSKQNGDWNTPETWDGTNIPNENLEVIIKSNVTLSGDGYAYGVTFDGGKLTIQDGGTLVIGQGGVTGATITNLKIDGDGILAIAPGVDLEIKATIDYVAKYAGKKIDAPETPTDVDQLYWEQMTVPTIKETKLALPGEFTSVFNTWDITKAWQKVANPETEVKDPFKGYFLTNFSAYPGDSENAGTPKIRDTKYTFSGVLTGSQINPFGFNREGFTFFGNSCLAPMSIPELLMDLNKDDIQATLYVYSPLQGSYHTINMATVGRSGRPVEINKLQGFFIYAYKKTSVAPTYQDIIWNPLLAKQTMGGNQAPHKAAMAAQSEISSAATMMITSAMGWTDDVVLFEGANFTNEFDQNYDAQKMNGDHVNMYVPSTQNMAVYAVADLEGTPITIATKDEVAYTFSFSDVEGRDFELFDAETQIATKIQEGNTYEFVAPANSTIEYRFFIRKAAQAPTNNETVRNAKAKGIYNMMGTYMGEAKRWNTLPAGVYVVDGVRVVK